MVNPYQICCFFDSNNFGGNGEASYSGRKPQKLTLRGVCRGKFTECPAGAGSGLKVKHISTIFFEAMVDSPRVHSSLPGNPNSEKFQAVGVRCKAGHIFIILLERWPIALVSTPHY